MPPGSAICLHLQTTNFFSTGTSRSQVRRLFAPFCSIHSITPIHFETHAPMREHALATGLYANLVLQAMAKLPYHCSVRGIRNHRIYHLRATSKLTRWCRWSKRACNTMNWSHQLTR